MIRPVPGCFLQLVRLATVVSLSTAMTHPLFAQAREPARLSPRNANYTIEARLDPTTHTILGRETLVWRNISANPVGDLRFHLYWNAWKDNRSAWMRERRLAGDTRLTARTDDDRSFIDITSVHLIDAQGSAIDVTGSQRFIAPDDGNPDDQTVMAIPLPRPVAPGESATVAMAWKAHVPRTFARTGVIGNFYFLAQWFPKVGVLEDTGWNVHQFHSSTEFFSDFGVYDVQLTVPAGWIVGATGREAEHRNNPDSTMMHRFRAEDVHDFAWTTSPDYVERTAHFDGVPERGVKPVDIRLLLQPEHLSQAERHVAATRAALRWYGDWFGSYPYSYLTVIDPAWQSNADGMEYPTLFTAGTRWLTPANVTTPESVTVHEAGHQWWYGVVATNEFENGWMDEGLNTFSQARVIDQVFSPNYLARRFFGGFIPWVFRDIELPRATVGNRLYTYRANAKSDSQSTPTFLGFPGRVNNITYDKTALWLTTLERTLGWPTLHQIMSTYFERWKFRHPKPDDFFAVANEISGRDLTPFFDQVHRSSNVFDYGVDTLFATPLDRGSGSHSVVVVRRYGEAVLPVDVLVVFDNGEKVRERWDGQERWRQFTYDRPSRVRSAVVDPDRVLLLDVNYTNNSRTLAPRAGEAATKWSLKWLVWLQDLMLTWAFLV
jgi:Peptidase family M1 domain